MLRIAVALIGWGVSVIGAAAQVSAPDALSLPELDRQLASYTELIKSKTASNTQSTLDLFRQVRDAMSTGKTTLAIGALETLSARRGGQGEGGARTWLKLAAAWRSQIAASPRCEPPAEASVAAYGAYKKAGTDVDRIEALAVLGSLLLQAAGQDNSGAVSCIPLQEVTAATEALGVTREGARRQAYRVFTRLGQLAGADRVGDTINQLSDFSVSSVTYPPPYAVNAKKGKRCDTVIGPAASTRGGAPDIDVVSASCEENATNQACVVFNRNLENPKLEEIGRLIMLRRIGDAGRSPDSSSRVPDDIRDNKACFSDLRPGAEYELTINRALKSVDGVALRKMVRSIVQMPDSEQSLGFQPETYILPANGPRKVTLRTMNVRRVELSLRRLGDRNLVREIVYKKIVGSFDATARCFVLKQIGEKISDGVAIVSGKRNETTPLEVPIGKILDDRKEWLTTNPRGGEKQWKNDSLSLTLFGDQASSDAGRQAGVFALFGRTGGKLDEPGVDNDTSADVGDDHCPSDINSQWFSLTNLGITLQRGHSDIYVIARELDTGAAVARASVELIARNGARLTTVATDDNGVGIIPARLGRGTGGNELVAVMANHGSDYAFLDLTAGALDLSDRGFEGRGPSTELDGFVVPTRGIYRAGETIEALVFLRGADGRTSRALSSFEVVLSRSDGSIVAKNEFLGSANPEKFVYDGGFLADLPIPEVTPDGSFELSVKVGDRKVGSAPIDIRDFQPHTVRIEQGTWSGTVSKTGTMEISGSATANYLYGERQNNAPAANLRAELDIRVEAAKTPKLGCYEDFTFGRSRDEFRAQLFRDSAISTDSQGKLQYRKAHEGVLQNSVPLRASVTIALLDPNGKAAESQLDVALKQSGQRWIGLRFRGSSVGLVNQPELFDVVTLDDGNNSERPQLWYSIYREQNSFVWYKDGSSWDFTAPTASREPVVEHIAISSPPQLAARQGACAEPVSFPVQFDRTGNYLIVVGDDKGAITELPVSHGWTTSPDGSLKPDALRVWTQSKESFFSGDALDIKVSTPHQAGRILGQIFVNGVMKAKFEGDISDKRELNVKVPVDNTWPPGTAYIYATSFRRAQKDNDSFAGGPGRAIGGTFVRIGNTTKAAVKIDAPQTRTTASISQRIEIPVTVDGLRGDVSVAMAIADEGVLLVNNFKTPDPFDHYFGKRRFDFDIFDSYGRIIYGKVGGDQVLAPLRGVGYRADEIVSWRSTIQKAVNGRVVFEIPAGTIKPDFEGEIRVMAWAWNADSLASAQDKFNVSDRLRMRLAAPRSIAPGETASLALQSRHLDGPEIGPVSVDVRATPPLALDNPSPEGQAQACDPVTDLSRCQRITVQPRKDADWKNIIRVRSESGPGTGTIGIQYVLDGVSLSRSWKVPVLSPLPRITQMVALETIPPGGSKTFGRAEFDGMVTAFDPSKVAVVARLSRAIASPDASQFFQDAVAVRQLDQLAHQAQLLLVSEKTADQSTASGDDEVKRRLETLIRELSALQSTDGGFVSDGQMVRHFQTPNRPYQIKEESVGETAFALDVLSRATAAGLLVPATAIDRGVGFLLSEFQSIVSSETKCSRPDRYALAVLVKMDRIASSSFRSVAARCLSDSTQTDKLILASAYNNFGFSNEAKKILVDSQIDQSTLSGQNPAENARAIALLIESQTDIDPAKLFDKIGLSTGYPYDLATASWVSRASRAALGLLKTSTSIPQGISVTPTQVVKRTVGDGLELKVLERSAIPDEGVRIINAGSTPLIASFLADGVPGKITTANTSIFDLKVRINGVAADSEKPIIVKQFDKVYFEVELNQRSNAQSAQRLALVEILPTGFEGMDKIVEPGWSGVLGTKMSLLRLSEITYSEFRNGRWIAALPWTEDDPSKLQSQHRLGFSATPLLPGEFVLPPLMVRDLNNPGRLGWTKPGRIIVSPSN
jgi:uncharacterized protein YfaS (alpha-2-macroglobulin family)